MLDIILHHHIYKYAPINTPAYLINLFRTYSPENNHYIFADLRGGSTWLSEIISSITKEPVMWEPLHMGPLNRPFNKLNFGWREYIEESELHEEARTVFDDLFRGKMQSGSALYRTPKNYLVGANSLLFKICRGNALLPWLTTNFQFKYKPVYLIRHPFAVVSSQLRTGLWGNSIERFSFDLSFRGAYNEILLEHQNILDTIRTTEEQLVAVWCITNSLTLNNPRNNSDWITMNYEELVLNPREQVQRILDEWNTPFDLTSINFSRSSETTKPDSPIDTKSRISDWQNKLTSDQINRMGRILDYFEIPWYSKDNAFPEVHFD